MNKIIGSLVVMTSFGAGVQYGSYQAQVQVINPSVQKELNELQEAREKHIEEKTKGDEK